jgi:hypothetical protein
MKLVELPIITKTVDPSEDMPVLEIKNNLKQLEEEMAEMEW